MYARLGCAPIDARVCRLQADDWKAARQRIDASNRQSVNQNCNSKQEIENVQSSHRRSRCREPRHSWRRAAGVRRAGLQDRLRSMGAGQLGQPAVFLGTSRVHETTRLERSRRAASHQR